MICINRCSASVNTAITIIEKDKIRLSRSLEGVQLRMRMCYVVLMWLLEGSWLLLEDSGTLVGRLWDASWKALGRFLEASKRHLGPKTVTARFFGRFLKKIRNFGRPSWRRLTSQIVFFGVPRGYPR